VKIQGEEKRQKGGALGKTLMKMICAQCIREVSRLPTERRSVERKAESEPSGVEIWTVGTTEKARGAGEKFEGQV